MDAFDTLVAAEPDGSSDSEAEAEPEPASEAAPARAPSADRAPAADRPAAPAEAKMKPKRKKDITGGDIEAPAPEAPPSSAWVCLRTWFGCLCGSTVLYSRDALKRAVRNGCPCLHPRVEQAVVCLALPPLWIWMGIRLLLLPCLYAYGGRCLGALFRFFYEGFERLMSRCGCNCDDAGGSCNATWMSPSRNSEKVNAWGDPAAKCGCQPAGPLATPPCVPSDATCSAASVYAPTAGLLASTSPPPPPPLLRARLSRR